MTAEVAEAGDPAKPQHVDDTQSITPVQRNSSSDTDALQAEIIQLAHDRLRLTDKIVGLMAENDRLRELDGDQNPLTVQEQLRHAWSRIEELEQTLLAAEHQRTQQLNNQRQEIQASMTWKLGAALLAPVRWVRRK